MKNKHGKSAALRGSRRKSVAAKCPSEDADRDVRAVEADGNGTVPLTVALAMEEIAMVADMIERMQMKFLAGKLRGSYGTIADHLTRKSASGANSVKMHKVSGKIVAEVYPNGLLVLREQGKRTRYQTTLGAVLTRFDLARRHEEGAGEEG